MTVNDLRKALDGFEPSTKVVFAFNSGDHWRTEVARRVGDVREGQVVHSAYHGKLKTVGEEDEDETTDAECVVVLR